MVLNFVGKENISQVVVLIQTSAPSNPCSQSILTYFSTSCTDNLGLNNNMLRK